MIPDIIIIEHPNLIAFTKGFNSFHLICYLHIAMIVKIFFGFLVKYHIKFRSLFNAMLGNGEKCYN